MGAPLADFFDPDLRVCLDPRLERTMPIAAGDLYDLSIQWFPDIRPGGEADQFAVSSSPEVDVYGFLSEVLYRSVLLERLRRERPEELLQFFQFVELLLREGDCNLIAAVQLRLVPYLRAPLVWEGVGEVYAGPELRSVPF